MKVKITLSYDGSKFYGFQFQKNGTWSVANKLKKIFKSLNIDPSFNCSGRTDRGVHALSQVIDINLPSFWMHDIDKLRRLMNTKAAPDIYIKKIEAVDDDFHSRYSAKRRKYRYFIKIGDPNPFLASYVLYVKQLDTKKIVAAISLFEGEHDFEYFKKSGSSVISSKRAIYRSKFYKYRDFYVFSFEANGYLRSQIRMMVGFLLQISDGYLNIDDLLAQLNLEKKISSYLVEPNGLYLSKIIY